MEAPRHVSRRHQSAGTADTQIHRTLLLVATSQLTAAVASRRRSPPTACAPSSRCAAATSARSTRRRQARALPHRRHPRRGRPGRVRRRSPAARLTWHDRRGRRSRPEPALTNTLTALNERSSSLQAAFVGLGGAVNANPRRPQRRRSISADAPLCLSRTSERIDASRSASRPRPGGRGALARNPRRRAPDRHFDPSARWTRSRREADPRLVRRRRRGGKGQALHTDRAAAGT